MQGDILAADVLRDIGMHPKYRGYSYLLLILSLTKQHPEYVYRMSAVVYPIVMDQFDCSRASVERNIRFAVLRTWESGNQAELLRLFGVYARTWMPTNTEFIAVLTETILNGRLRDAGQLSLPMEMALHT